MQSSFARYMCSQGFDTWILEVRGAGLSREEGLSESQQPAITNSDMEPLASRNSQVLAESHTAITERLPTLHDGS